MFNIYKILQITHQMMTKYAYFHVSSAGADNYKSFESNSKYSWPKIWVEILDRYWQIGWAEKVIIVKIIPFRTNSFVWHKNHLLCARNHILKSKLFWANAIKWYHFSKIEASLKYPYKTRKMIKNCEKIKIV